MCKGLSLVPFPVTFTSVDRFITGCTPCVLCASQWLRLPLGIYNEHESKCTIMGTSFYMLCVEVSYFC